MTDVDQQAWVVRMRTGGGDVVDFGVESRLLLLGWSGAQGLVSCDAYWQFRDIVHNAHYGNDEDYRRSGHAASQLWAFIHEMNEGDLVVVPHGSSFYVGEVSGPASETWDEGPEDTAHRRPVRWRNSAAPIPRSYARSALISRMNSRKTVTSATDLVAEILEAVDAASGNEAPTLAAELRRELIATTKKQLLTGHMNERRFEELVRDLVLSLGAIAAHVVPRRQDKGADIEAEFSVGHFATIPVRIQVKYWRGDAGPYPIDQLLQAMDDVDLGVVVTTAAFGDDVRQYAADRAAEVGKQLRLIDGDELCALIVDYGLDVLLARGRA